MKPKVMLFLRAWHQREIRRHQAEMADEMRRARLSSIPPRRDLRRAKPSDIKAGEIIWYPKSRVAKWVAVERPICKSKFVSQETVFSLKGAFVEI
jgi:hypothetical protein